MLIDEKKLREKLKWVIFPFKNSGSVPKDLVDQIINAINECKIVEVAEAAEATVEETIEETEAAETEA